MYCLGGDMLAGLTFFWVFGVLVVFGCVGSKKRGECNYQVKSNVSFPPWNLNKKYEGTMIAFFFGIVWLVSRFIRGW